MSTQNYLDSVPSPQTDSSGTESLCSLENLDTTEAEAACEAQGFKTFQIAISVVY